MFCGKNNQLTNNFMKDKKQLKEERRKIEGYNNPKKDKWARRVRYVKVNIKEKFNKLIE